jgi:hypothetical protein
MLAKSVNILSIEKKYIPLIVHRWKEKHLFSVSSLPYEWFKSVFNQAHTFSPSWIKVEVIFSEYLYSVPY